MDTYYGKEDQVETPETTLDNLRAQSSATSAVTVWAKESLVNIYDKSLEIWNLAGDLRSDAEVRGDQVTAAHLTGLQNSISELYKGTEHIQQALLHSNATQSTILEATEVLAKQKQAVEAELTTLVTAIEEADFSDPRIEQMAEMIETDLYEMISYNSESFDDDAYVEGRDSAYDDITSEVYKTIKTYAPQTSYLAAERLFATLRGDYPLTDIQQGLLLSLLETVSAELSAAS